MIQPVPPEDGHIGIMMTAPISDSKTAESDTGTTQPAKTTPTKSNALEQ